MMKTMQKYDFKQQLNVISNIRLPMILLIVSVHVVPDIVEGTWDWWIVSFIGREMASIGVPMFFLISGLLFFCNIDKGQSVRDFTKIIYSGGGKIEKRIKSVLVPYLAWNLITYMVLTLVYKKASFELDVLFSHRVFFDWNYEPVGFIPYPCDGPLWFLRNLFVISLCAPLVFAFVKYVKAYIGIPFLVLFYITNIISAYDMGIVGTFSLFTIGAYIGLNRWCVLPFILRYGYVLPPFYVIGVLFDLYIMNVTDAHIYIYRTFIMLGIPTLVYATSRLPQKYKDIEFPSLSMFIYCAHGFLLAPVMSLFRHSGIESMNVVYAGNIVGTVMLCVMGYLVLKYWLPKKIGIVLLGGRI